MKYLQILVFAFLVSSCGIRVNYDYETATDFNAYKSYAYFSDLQTGLSDLDTKRLLRILDKALQAKGFQKSDYADFYINIVSSEYENPNRNTVGVGVGGTGGNVGGGVTIGIPVGQSKNSREVVFEFVDANTNQLFWQAISESNYNPNSNPDKREANLQAIVTKVLEGYPPNK